MVDATLFGEGILQTVLAQYANTVARGILLSNCRPRKFTETSSGRIRRALNHN
eukprot:COSAG06_NODE_576_length_14051_cov_5.354644_11_plen_53_part_00